MEPNPKSRFKLHLHFFFPDTNLHSDRFDTNSPQRFIEPIEPDFIFAETFIQINSDLCKHRIANKR